MDDGGTERLAGLLDELAATLRAAGGHRFIPDTDGYGHHDRADLSHELVADIDERQQLLDFMAGAPAACVPRSSQPPRSAAMA